MQTQDAKIGTRAKTRKGRERPHLRASGIAPALSQLRVKSLPASLVQIRKQ